MELRYVLLSGFYRQPLNFTFSSLATARKALARLAGWQRRLGGSPDFLLPGEEDFGPFGPVLEGLLADLNTPEALGRLHAIGREILAAHESGLLPPAMGWPSFCNALGSTSPPLARTRPPPPRLPPGSRPSRPNASKPDAIVTGLSPTGSAIKSTRPAGAS